MAINDYFNQQYFDLLLAMTEKEIKARYKNAVFGFLWMFLNPLFQMLIIGFIFQYVTKVSIPHYFVFLFAGLLPWNFFSYTVTKNTPLMVFERSLLQKAKFPREILIFSMALANIFHLVISIILLLPVLLVIGKFQLLNLLLLPLALIWIMLVTVGFSLSLATWNIRFRDVNFFVQALMPLWFYATPILYTLNLLPQKLHLWFYLNPLTGIIELFDWILLSGPITQMAGLLISLGVSLIVILIGIKVFIKESPYFVDWL